MSTSNADMMSPDASPVQTATVRSANNLPLYLGLIVLLIVVAIVAMVASDRAKQQIEITQGTTNETQISDTSQLAREIAGNRLTGYIDPKDQPAVVDINPTVEIAEAPGLLQQDSDGNLYVASPNDETTLINPDIAPTPPVLNNSNTLVPNVHNPIDEEALRIQQAKLQALEAAVKAGTTVQITARSSTAPTPTAQNFSTPQRSGNSTSRQNTLNEISGLRREASENNTDAVMASLTQQISNATQGLPGSNSGSSNNGAASQNNVVANSENGDLDRWQLGTQLEAPISDYVVRTGSVIPATMITGINSDLPGQIVAQVSQNVFDTGIGSSLLIPQGSKLIGSYVSNVAYNQRRVMVAWQRIIYPDGKALDIGSMPGADIEGYSGFSDQVNNHYLRIFGSALLMSGITASISISQGDIDNDDDSSRSAGQELSAAVGQQLGQVAIEMIRKNMNISPTLEIRPGFKFNVMVTKDLPFYGPYKAYDY